MWTGWTPLLEGLINSTVTSISKFNFSETQSNVKLNRVENSPTDPCFYVQQHHVTHHVLVQTHHHDQIIRYWALDIALKTYFYA